VHIALIRLSMGKELSSKEFEIDGPVLLECNTGPEIGTGSRPEVGFRPECSCSGR
jgi:hypothetical protein